MMKRLHNEKGIALVLVLVLALISLAIVSAMLFMITQGTQMSGSFRFFRTAEEASLGGVEIATQFVKNAGTLPGIAGLSNLVITADACLNEKITLSRSSWTANCSATERSLLIDAADATTFDMRFDLGNYRVFTKIVDTIEGNSETGGIVTDGTLGGAGVVASSSGLVSPPHNPYLYKIEVQAQNSANATERSRKSLLYAH
jgi:hypothetical protein